MVVLSNSTDPDLLILTTLLSDESVGSDNKCRVSIFWQGWRTTEEEDMLLFEQVTLVQEGEREQSQVKVGS